MAVAKFEQCGQIRRFHTFMQQVRPCRANCIISILNRDAVGAFIRS